MIIQINATVCAAENHGEDKRDKAADSDWLGRLQEVQERLSDQEKQETEEACRQRWFLSRWRSIGTTRPCSAAGPS